MDTGSAGLAGDVPVVPFGDNVAPSSGSSDHGASTADHRLPWFTYGLAGLLLAGLGLRWRRDTKTVPAEAPSEVEAETPST
jgi:hypothetical protein